MSLAEQVLAQASALAGELDERQAALLEVLCGAAVASLTAQLKEGYTPEDCPEAFVQAASLYALAAMEEAGNSAGVEEFRAGDLTVKKGSRAGAASRCLQRQAEMLMASYLKDRFSFAGV